MLIIRFDVQNYFFFTPAPKKWSFRDNKKKKMHFVG